MPIPESIRDSDPSLFALEDLEPLASVSGALIDHRLPASLTIDADGRADGPIRNRKAGRLGKSSNLRRFALPYLPMPKKKPQSGRNQVWVFVDTNIYLDYYRSANEANFQLLERLEKVKDRIICTYQVEMEFLKNRQKVLLESVKAMQAPKQPSIPAILKERKVGKAVKAKTDEALKQTKLLREQVRRLLDKPSASDTVFKTLEGVFQSQSDMVLTRDMKERVAVKRKALRRFMLGYPPRKKTDTAYGDAINWEWLIEVANKVTGKLVIVSRDSDFGCTHDDEHFLNDQLRQEYKDRVGKRRPIIYTQKLSDALKLLNVKVTEREVAAESDLMQVVRDLKKSKKQRTDASSDDVTTMLMNSLIRQIRMKSEGEDPEG